MKADMLMMAAQLQDAEERVLEAADTGVAAAPSAPTPAGGSPVREPAMTGAAKNAPLNKKIQYLQEQLGAKDKKVAALRLAIVNLKREFEKAEVANLKRDLANEEEKEDSGAKVSAWEVPPSLLPRFQRLAMAFPMARNDSH